MAQHGYTFAELCSAVEHALGGTPDSRTSAADIVNDAVLFLSTHRPWSWRRRISVLPVTPISVTTLTRSGNIVTATTAAHGLRPDDWIAVTDTAEASFHTAAACVLSTPTTTSLTYAQTGDDDTSTGGYMWRGHLPLADDCGQLLSVHSAAPSVRCVPTTLSAVISRRLRAETTIGAPWHYAVRPVPQNTATVSPAMRLELAPIPATARQDAFVVEYLRTPPAISQPDAVPDMPPAFLPALKRLCRAMALSEEDEQEGPDWNMFWRMLERLVVEDASLQTNLGPSEGGLLQNGAVDCLEPSRITPAED